MRSPKRGPLRRVIIWPWNWNFSTGARYRHNTLRDITYIIWIVTLTTWNVTQGNIFILAQSWVEVERVRLTIIELALTMYCTWGKKVIRFICGNEDRHYICSSLLQIGNLENSFVYEVVECTFVRIIFYENMLSTWNIWAHSNVMQSPKQGLLRVIYNLTLKVECLAQERGTDTLHCGCNSSYGM